MLSRLASAEGIPHHEVERGLGLEHPGDLLAEEGRLHRLGDFMHAQAIAGNRCAFKLHREKRDVGLLLHREIGHPLTPSMAVRTSWAKRRSS